ncbi:30338_t:CDS:1, partial [Racocetra persica]
SQTFGNQLSLDAQAAQLLNIKQPHNKAYKAIIKRRNSCHNQPMDQL